MPSPRVHRPLVVPVLDAALREDSLRRWLVPLVLGSGARALHLDLADVEVPTTPGLVKLVGLHRELRAAGVGFALVNARPEVYEVLSATGLTRLFEVRPERADWGVEDKSPARECRHAAATA